MEQSGSELSKPIIVNVGKQEGRSNFYRRDFGERVLASLPAGVDFMLGDTDTGIYRRRIAPLYEVGPGRDAAILEFHKPEQGEA